MKRPRNGKEFGALEELEEGHCGWRRGAKEGQRWAEYKFGKDLKVMSNITGQLFKGLPIVMGQNIKLLSGELMAEEQERK